MFHPIVEEELALLEKVATLLAENPEPPGPSEEPLVRELERLRELLVSGSDMKDRAALQHQWDRQSALLRQLRTSRAQPKVDPNSPYFAHLRLRENGVERDLCLGRATCIRDGVRIVDWRNAPVSKIYYRYQQGEEYEEEVAGRLREGLVVARRGVDIHDDALRRIEAPEGVFTPGEDGRWRREEREAPRLAGGEGSALRAHVSAETDARLHAGLTGALGARRRTDKHLPEITSLIDPTQFDLITRPRSGFVAIRGTAGSGKTTVALHRIAYLAFDDPEVDSERTVFIVFHPALRSYVSHVLPALGVSNVRIVTWREWAAEQRKRHFPDLPNHVREDAPALTQRLKLHPALDRALAEQVARVEGPPTANQAIDDWASVLTQAPLLEKVFEEEDAGVTRGAIKAFVEDTRRRLDELQAWLAGQPETHADLDPEDDALLLRAWQLRVGPLRHQGRRPLRYRHAAVDEVQDFAPIEIRVLLDCLDERKSLTLAGDTQQHLAQEGGFTSWSAFLAELGLSGAEVETLRVSYRSSHEIATFARAVLGPLAEDDTPPVTTRSGPPVESFRFPDHGACVAFLADALRDLVSAEPLASIAVLTPSPELSATYCDGLLSSDVPGVRRVADQDFTFAPGIEVTEIEQARGLEFDYVILTEVTHERFPEDPGARRRLHVGATRAVHQLWLASVGTPSPLLAAPGAGVGSGAGG